MTQPRSHAKRPSYLEEATATTGQAALPDAAGLSTWGTDDQLFWHHLKQMVGHRIVVGMGAGPNPPATLSAVKTDHIILELGRDTIHVRMDAITYIIVERSEMAEAYQGSE